jgi:hypothetical protein
MKNTDYWFLTGLLSVAILVGMFLWLRVPGEAGIDNLRLTEASASGMLVESINPVSGKVSGGEEVLILGKNFPEDVEVLFGNQLATSVKRSDEGSIVATTPEATQAGVVNMILIDKSGNTASSPQLFFYTNE